MEFTKKERRNSLKEERKEKESQSHAFTFFYPGSHQVKVLTFSAPPHPPPLAPPPQLPSAPPPPPRASGLGYCLSVLW